MENREIFNDVLKLKIYKERVSGVMVSKYCVQLLKNYTLFYCIVYVSIAFKVTVYLCGCLS